MPQRQHRLITSSLHEDLLTRQDESENILYAPLSLTDVLTLTDGRACPFKVPIRTNMLVYIIRTAHKQTADISCGEQRQCGATACGHKLITACKMPDPVGKVRHKLLGKIKTDGSNKWGKMAAETVLTATELSKVHAYHQSEYVERTWSNLHKKCTLPTGGRSAAICHAETNRW